MRDVESGLRVIGPRARRDHLARRAYGNQARIADARGKWSGYADPTKQAMADAGLIPQRPEIGEVVNRHGFVDSLPVPMDDRHTGKDNGIPRAAENVRCTSERYPTPIVVGSYWPRNRDGSYRPIIRIE